jgi:DNA polymerase-4
MNPPRIMHVDINSCFASIEQQTYPNLRDKPVAVAAYASPGGCILAASREAKEYGVKTGMRVRDGKILCPGLIVVEPNPNKYRDVHRKLRRLLKNHTDKVSPKSIDEFVLSFKDYEIVAPDLWAEAYVIKKEIKQKIGEYVTVSIGIGPNRFLAKTASNLKKPDGLEEINSQNFLKVYARLNLTDLNGIARRNERRLRQVGIKTVLEFYDSPIWKLKIAFGGIGGYYWWLRLHGCEIDAVEFARRTFGNSYAFANPNFNPLPILQKLCDKTGTRLRAAGYKARGVHLAISYKDHTFWHKGIGLKRYIFDGRDIFKEMKKMLVLAPQKPIHILAESVFGLTKSEVIQNELFENVIKKASLVRAVDVLNNRFGDSVVIPAGILLARDFVRDRIAFGQ